MNTIDVIDGGAGFDTITILAGGLDSLVAPATPVISNVERIDNGEGAATVLDLRSVTGLEQLWTTGAAGSYAEAKLTTVYGVSGCAGRAVNLDFTNSALAGASTLQLATTMTGGAVADIIVAAADAGLIENLAINAASGNSVVDLDTNALTTLASVTVSGAGVVQLTETAAATTVLTNFDASENTGGVSYTSGALAAPVTVAGGEGNDTLNFGAAAAGGRLTLDAGAGNDIITGGAGRDTIVAGAGNDVVNGSASADTITLGEGNDVVVYTALTQSQFTAGATNTTRDVITDFKTSGTDTIDLAGIGGKSMNAGANLINIQNAVDALAPTATLADALGTIVAGNSAANAVSYFQFQGNTYVVVDDGAAAGAYNALDMVIELSGSVTLATADFAF